MMGLKPSPYLTTQSMEWAEDSTREDYCDRDKPFQWFNINLNLPRYSKY